MVDAVYKVGAIRAELNAIEDWDLRFSPLDVLDEIGLECRRLRREALLHKLADAVSRN